MWKRSDYKDNIFYKSISVFCEIHGVKTLSFFQESRIPVILLHPHIDYSLICKTILLCYRSSLYRWVKIYVKALTTTFYTGTDIWTLKSCMTSAFRHARDFYCFSIATLSYLYIGDWHCIDWNMLCIRLLCFHHLYSVSINFIIIIIINWCLLNFHFPLFRRKIH